MSSAPPPSYAEAINPPYPTTESPLFPQPTVATGYQSNTVPLNQHQYGYDTYPQPQTSTAINPPGRFFTSSPFGNRQYGSGYYRNSPRGVIAIIAIATIIGIILFLIVFFTIIRRNHTHYVSTLEDEFDRYSRQLDAIDKYSKGGDFPRYGGQQNY